MNNKICNPKVEVPSGTNLNDKDYLNSLLSLLKEMEKNYTTILTEVSNEYLFSEHDKAFNEIKRLQREVYELLFKKGWYTLEKAEDMKINEKYNIFREEFNDLTI